MSVDLLTGREPATFEERVEFRLQTLPVDKLKDGLVIDETPDFDRYVEALMSGMPVVCEGYADLIKAVKTHEVIPDKTIERRRSAHGVSFGRLVGYKQSKRREGTIFSIAYKPFEHVEKAVQELYGYKILQKLGVDTFDPIGIVPQEEGGAVVITRKRDDLQSLDRDEWIVGRQPKDAREVEIAERNTVTVKEIAGVLANLHSQGVFHPDGQIKNFAVNENRQIGVIDTENLTVRDTADLDNFALAWTDIEKLTKSIIHVNDEEVNGDSEDKIFGVGMLAHMNLPQLRNACLELIIEPYLECLEELIAQGGDSDYLTALGVEIQDMFEKDTKWPQDLVADVGRS